MGLLSGMPQSAMNDPHALHSVSSLPPEGQSRRPAGPDATPLRTAARLALYARGRATRRNGFISFISGVSMFGIALGVAALIIVLSVMNGFQKEVRDRMLGVISHIEIFSRDGQALRRHGEPSPRRRARTRT